jgi:hypothetical protein
LHGQAAIELLAYAAFFLLVFVSAVSVFLYAQSQDAARAENAYAQEIAYSFADSIKTAFAAGPGFRQTVPIEPTLLGKPYALSVSRRSDPALSETGFVYVSWLSPLRFESFSAPTVTASYAFAGRGGAPNAIYSPPGTDIIVINCTAGYVNISNVAGTIRFE